MDKKQRSPLLLMALTILIDFTGFGLIIPLLPFWAERLGANPLGIGTLITIYALAQFIFTPLLGSLSDRYGRRPIILWSLLIEALSLVLTAVSGSFAMLLLARAIGGLGASNIGSAQAVVSDVTSNSNRAKGMGYIGAAIGAGFVLGPALGGLLTPIGPTLPFWVAAGIALLNACLVFFLLPETHRPHTNNTGANNHNQPINTLLHNFRHAAHMPVILRLILVNLIYTVAFAGMETIFPLFSQKTFGWGATQNAYMFTYIGFIVILMQGGIVRQLVKHWREQTIMWIGLLILALGLITLAFSSHFALLLISIGLISVGDGAVSPTISTTLSFVSAADAQGETLGLAQGFAGLGRIIGPALAGSVDTLSNPSMPLLISGILVILSALIVFPVLSKIHRPDDSKQHTKHTGQPFALEQSK
ncbi:MAG TPA: MFS transporter [Dictyobacter sp.]|jgi:multidrug resistance protein|nr:MFS transporter [Dictyobacter sp.]